MSVPSVVANLTTNQLTINGSGFPADSTVQINGLPVDVSSLTPTSIVAALPPAVAAVPGSYLLTIRRSHDGHVNDGDDFLAGFVVTVGAVGAAGPAGPQGL